MLKITDREKKILDALLTASPEVVAMRLKIDRQTVYSTKHYFRKKVQNAQEFLAVAKSKYQKHLSRRLQTPNIMPVDEDEDLFLD